MNYNTISNIGYFISEKIKKMPAVETAGTNH